MTRQGDIVAEIKDRVPTQEFDLSRAEGRADFDDALRAALWSLAPDDEQLRRHAGDMLREWRMELFAGARPT